MESTYKMSNKPFDAASAKCGLCVLCISGLQQHPIQKVVYAYT